MREKIVIGTSIYTLEDDGPWVRVFDTDVLLQYHKKTRMMQFPSHALKNKLGVYQLVLNLRDRLELNVDVVANFLRETVALERTAVLCFKEQLVIRRDEKLLYQQLVKEFIK